MSAAEYEKRADEVMEAIRTGKFVYDVSGSAHWNNMCDIGLVVHRDFDTQKTRVITRKVREQGVYGNIGECFFNYDLSERVYKEVIESNSEQPQQRWYNE